MRQVLRLLAAALFAVPTAAHATSDAAPCAGVALPIRMTTAPSALPASYLASRVGGVVVDEVVIGPDGKVGDVRMVRTRIPELAPYGQKSVQDSRFTAGSVDGHPAAVRGRVSTSLGTLGKARAEPEYDLVWAFVPAGQPREAVWQLAGSVESLMLEAHLGTVAPQGAEIVALAPDAKERVLWKTAASASPVDVREKVSTGKFFAHSGDYRIELRAGGKALAWTTLTIADDFTRAVINACGPI